MFLDYLSVYYLTEIWSNKQKVHDSNMFLTQCWRLDTTSRPFHNFNEITVQWNLTIFSSWCLPYLILLYLPFQKNETLAIWHNWLLSNWLIGYCIIKQVAKLKSPWKLAPVLQIIHKISEKYCHYLYLSIGQVWWVN